MPVASKPGAPRPRTTRIQPRYRRCLGVLTKERMEELVASGELSARDGEVMRKMFETLEAKAKAKGKP